VSKYLIILLYLLPIISIATSLNESFTGTTFPPIGWSIINRDGGTEIWRRDTAINKTPPASTASRFENSLRSDDWLITPGLIVYQNDSLSFWYRRRFGNYDTLRIKVSITTNHPDSFNLLLLENRVTTETFTREVISLTNFSNDTIFIAFIHNAPSNQGTLYLDDITGPEMVEIRDVGVDTILSPANTFVMRPFGIGFLPQARIQNYSNTIQRNIPVVCSIVGQGSFLYYVNIKYLDSLLIDSSKVITFDTFAPMIAELCTVKIRTLLTNDINPANDRKIRTTQTIQGQYTGGPDNNYSYWIDSDTTGGPIYNWTDITLTGQSLPSGNMNISWQTPIGFNFNYYGEPESLFYYSTNGFISFDGLSSSYPNNQPIPSSDLPNKIVTPFWDRLWVISARHQLFDTSPNRYQIIQWNAICNPISSDFRDTVIFQAILYESGDIVFQYNRCDNRFNLGQGQSATIGIEDDSGVTGLQYLCNGAPQGNLLSAGRAIRFYRSCHDVMLDSILTSQVGIGDTVSPKVVIKNLGTSDESFLTVFNIVNGRSLIYADTIELNNLPPMQSCTLSFDEWVASQYGTYTAKAWTTLDNDFNRNNDTCYQELDVSIVAPVLLYPMNGYATNIATISFDWSDIANVTRYNFQVINNVDTVIINSQYGPINLSEGNYYWRVRAGNNERWGFWSETYTFIIDTTSPVSPILISPAQNCTLYQSYPDFVWNRVDGAVLYNLVVSTGISTYMNQTTSDTTYQSIQPFTSGTYFWKVRCQDQVLNWSYFSPIQVFYVQGALSGSWERKQDIPELFSNKPVKDGGCLVGFGNRLYALKGNNTQDFYDYELNGNQWNIRNFIPFFTNETLTRKRKVKGGGALVCTNNFIYALKGNSTREFWMYDPTLDNWVCKKPVPSLRGIRNGSGLAYHNGFVYCLVGSSNDFEFYQYDITQDTWLSLAPAPIGTDHRRFRSGSCIVYGGDNRIYTLKGGARYNEFYCYNISSNSWQARESLPYFHPSINKKTKVKAGGAMCFDGMNIIYAVKGGGTNEFWNYNILTNQWSASETIPRVTKRSVVKSGAGLAFADNSIWLLKGNKTRELWEYTIQSPKAKVRSQKFAGTCEQTKGTFQSTQEQKCIKVHVGKSIRKIVFLRGNEIGSKKDILKDIPDNASIKIFDIQGRMVQSVKSKSFLSLDYLKNGVYIIVVEDK
jgi:hypothetical protein